MKVRFGTEELAYLYQTPLDKIRRKYGFGKEIVKQFKRKIDILMAISNITQLRQFRSLNFEFLKGDHRGACSIRLNDQYRLIFEQKFDGQIEVLLITEVSKHYE